MGMSIDIDGSIKELSKWRENFNYDNGDYCYGGNTTEYSLDVAIETMRKFQRIQAIVEAWKADVDIDSFDCMADIYEVVGDGNNN